MDSLKPNAAFAIQSPYFRRTATNRSGTVFSPLSPTKDVKQVHFQPTPSPSPELAPCSAEHSDNSPDNDEPFQLPMITISNEETGEERSLCFTIPKPLSPYVYLDWTVKYELEPAYGTEGVVVFDDLTYSAPHKYIWRKLPQPMSQELPLIKLGERISQKQRAIRRAATAKPELEIDRLVLKRLNGRFPLPAACIRSSERILRALGITFVEYENGEPIESFFSAESILSITRDVAFCPMSLNHTPLTRIKADMEEYLENRQKNLLVHYLLSENIATTSGVHGAISLYCLSDFIRFVSFLARKHGGCILKVEKRLSGVKCGGKKKFFKSQRL